MCGRYTSSRRREVIAERFQVTVPEAYEERYNLAPAQRALIVRERDGEREAVLARWGLLPHWAKDARVAFKMINARAETLAGKPAFRSLLGKHRCLVVADGFYEWTIGPDGKKHPVHFRLADGGLFAFAGLSTSRRDEDTDELVESCTIVTDDAERAGRPCPRPDAGGPATRCRGRLARPGTAEGAWAGAARALSGWCDAGDAGI